MKKTNNEAEIVRLKRELSDANKQIEKLQKDSEKSEKKIAKLQKEFKKKDVRSVTLTQEPEQSLSNLSKDINIPNLLSD